MIYFDNAATTKISNEVLDSILDISKNYFANASSLHRLGFLAEQKIINSKEQIASVLSVSKEEIYFTSGGTEANNIAIFGVSNAYKKAGNKIITTKIEHPSVLSPFKNLEKDFEVTYLDVDKKGYIDLNQLENSIDENTIFVSIMHVNNEIGTIQNIHEVGKIIKQKNKDTIFHVDAVQAFGKIEINIKNIDLLSISGHKIHAQKGIGALYIKKGTKIKKLFFGSKEQNDLRPGTLNNEGIIALGVAAKNSHRDLFKNYENVLEIKKSICKLKTENLLTGIEINGDYENGSPYILSLSFDNIKSEVLLHSLEEENIFVSTGSACSSKDKNKISTIHHINKDNANNTIRLSFSKYNTLDEAEIFKNAILKIVPKLREYYKK